MTDSEQAALAEALKQLGCPEDKAPEMAAQLDKRATQLAAEQNRTHAEALAHLLNLMKEGWAAQQNDPSLEKTQQHFSQ